MSYLGSYTKYVAHDKSAQVAYTRIPLLQEIQEQLHVMKHYPIAELKFIEEASLQVIKCRRMLKYVAAYAYFCIKYDDGDGTQTPKQ
jgi:hypothetical protein